MSTGNRKKVACVTGGTGYIASALIKMLLEKGYAHVCFDPDETPDDTAKNRHLKELQGLGPLEILRADLEDEGSFDEAIARCDYAFLVAAPASLKTLENPEKELIEPAVRGTLNVMRSCAKAKTVKRVILTSSASSITRRPDLQGDGHVLDDESVSDVELLRATKPPGWGYAVSKVLLEKAASRFAAEHGISLVTVCPVVTAGAAPATRVRTSVPNCLSLLSGDEAEFAVLRGIEALCGTIPLVHVDDVCRAEMFVAEAEAAAGKYLCCSVNTTILELARFLADKYPQSGDLLEKSRMCVSSVKLEREGFEYKYKTRDGMYDDMVEYGKALGILPKGGRAEKVARLGLAREPARAARELLQERFITD
ncbi:hypothetical protein HU200_063523 [Digitaria exilis]|uniref:NAD-dependent epimerase/dehydratase domain-containing protein n=1 Tax=Digitaria exilis TaxID=1010633 RepID=A0A835DV71_9POAL|nr:hypothetical protein HU200_063523 [Digitaria exilis]